MVTKNKDSRRSMAVFFFLVLLLRCMRCFYGLKNMHSMPLNITQGLIHKYLI